MMPTLLAGDHIFVDKTSHTWRRGHVFVFQFPEHPEQDFVKRAIAIGGDRLEMRNRHPWINGWEVPHCSIGKGKLSSSTEPAPIQGEVFLEHLEGQAYLTFLADNPLAESEGPWVVRPGEAFMLGDNRGYSHDSRMWFGGQGGGVPSALARGEPVVIWMSVDDNGLVRSRTGQQTSKPTLPASLAALQPGLDRCLAQRPPLEATVPPKGL